MITIMIIQEFPMKMRTTNVVQTLLSLSRVVSDTRVMCIFKNSSCVGVSCLFQCCHIRATQRTTMKNEVSSKYLQKRIDSQLSIQTTVSSLSRCIFLVQCYFVLNQRGPFQIIGVVEWLEKDLFQSCITQTRKSFKFFQMKILNELVRFQKETH